MLNYWMVNLGWLGAVAKSHPNHHAPMVNGSCSWFKMVQNQQRSGMLVAKGHFGRFPTIEIDAKQVRPRYFFTGIG